MNSTTFSLTEKYFFSYTLSMKSHAETMNAVKRIDRDFKSHKNTTNF